jgi:hypothetical protein
VAFDKTQPTDTTKIRNLGVVIRPNWVAIEQGDDTFRPLAENLQNRTPSALPPDPTLLADTSKLYCKEDGSGVAELFNMDATGQIIQLTEDGNMGGQTTGIYTNSISFDGGTSAFTKILQPSGWLISNSAGVLQSGSGDLTVSRDAQGLYSIGFVVAPATTTFVGFAIPQNTTSRRSISCEQYIATGFKVRIYSNSTGSDEDEPFQVIVFGGR